MDELSDAQIVDRIRRRFRITRRFSVAVRDLGWEYKPCWDIAVRTGTAKEFGIGRRRVRKTCGEERES